MTNELEELSEKARRHFDTDLRHTAYTCARAFYGQAKSSGDYAWMQHAEGALIAMAALYCRAVAVARGSDAGEWRNTSFERLVEIADELAELHKPGGAA